MNNEIVKLANNKLKECMEIIEIEMDVEAVDVEIILIQLSSRISAAKLLLETE